MPITQTRLLDLLTEDETNFRAYRALAARMEEIVASDMPDNALRNAIRMTLLSLGELTSDKIMYAERRHFNSHARRNARTRERARAIRRANGVPERNSDQYRLNAMAHQMQHEADREYLTAMQGQPITERDVAPRTIAVGKPDPSPVAYGLNVASANVAGANATPTFDDTSPDPARWSPERLAAEATRGTVGLDEV